MNNNNYFITQKEASEILMSNYGLRGSLHPLPGEVDRNFKVETASESFLLKISPQQTQEGFLIFQEALLEHLRDADTPLLDTSKEGIAVRDNEELEIPRLLQNREGQYRSTVHHKGEVLHMRLLTYVEGKLWSDLNDHPPLLLYSLGQQAGTLTRKLQGFMHPYAKRSYKWDLKHTPDTGIHQNIFEGEQRRLIQKFYDGYQKIADSFQNCRHSVVHNDVNNHNIVVTPADQDYRVKSIIDFGDALYTATISDLAVCLTYAMMDHQDPLSTAWWVIKGYQREFSLFEEELTVLYWLIGARLVISLTTSTVGGQQHPENTYLQISQAQAWALIKKWDRIHPDLAQAHFKKAAGFSAHRNYELFSAFARRQGLNYSDLLGQADVVVEPLNLDISSSSIPDLTTYRDPERLRNTLREYWVQAGGPLLVGGYGEIRPDYITDSFKEQTSEGIFYKSHVLHQQLWLFQKKNIFNPLGGKIIAIEDQRLILQHDMIEVGASGKEKFYSIYSQITPGKKLQIGSYLHCGELLGSFQPDGSPPFGIQLALLNPLEHAPQNSCIHHQSAIYEELFPDPNLLFEIPQSVEATHEGRGPLGYSHQELLNLRKKHLGKSLSLSYRKPLKMLRGDGLYLIDHTGRKYMDLVNNVAHVGHEHPGVVKAGSDQMGMLNTNTRYLHDSIVIFAQNLLATFPRELSIVHFVNSGSEANELAIRMAKAVTGQKDFITMEVGYHGNTNACIDISSYKFDGKGGKGKPEHTHVVPLPDPLRGRYVGEKAGQKYAAHVSDYIEQIGVLGRKPAAFIAESIISCAGQVELPDGFLSEAYRATREAGGVCIADEVQVGCGRLGKAFWGFELHGVLPDIVTVGKPLGNGHPLAAVVCTQEVAQAFANGMEYFNTFGGNPVSCAIGNQVLQIIKDEKLQENALETGNYLKEELRKLQRDFPIIADVRGQGLFLGLELLTSDLKPLPKQATYLVDRMKDLGYLLSTEGPDDNVLKIKPPLVFRKQDALIFSQDLRRVFEADYMSVIP